MLNYERGAEESLERRRGQIVSNIFLNSRGVSKELGVNELKRGMHSSSKYSTTSTITWHHGAWAGERPQ